MSRERQIERVRGLLRAARAAAGPADKQRAIDDAREALADARAMLAANAQNRWLSLPQLAEANREALDALGRALEELAEAPLALSDATLAR